MKKAAEGFKKHVFDTIAHGGVKYAEPAYKAIEKDVRKRMLEEIN